MDYQVKSKVARCQSEFLKIHRVAFGRPKMSVWGHAGARSRTPKVACISFLRARMVCSFGALKLCERHPVNGYTFLASYYAIGTYSVIGSDRSSVASRALGTSPEFAEINSEIVYLGDHLGRSGYCPPVAVRTWTPAGFTIPLGCLQVAAGVVGGCFIERA